MAETHYEILGVPRNADPQTIRKAYLKLSMKHHPDKNPGNEHAAKQAFVKIGQAYEILSDPALRKEYDAELRGGRFGGFGGFGGRGRTENSSNEGTGQSNTGFSANFDSSDYDNYREAFDATMAGLSEDELRDVMGAAALIGSVIGGIVGARMVGGQNTGAAGTILRGLGGMIGSAVASEAATTLVATAHKQSTERSIMDQERKERIARGEAVPEREVSSAQQAWRDLINATKEIVKEKAVEAFAGEKSSHTGTYRR